MPGLVRLPPGAAKHFSGFLPWDFLDTPLRAHNPNVESIMEEMHAYTQVSKGKDSAIIVSGGMDSVTLMHEMRDRIALAISFDYGSNHNHRELAFARYHAGLLGTRHVVLDLKFMAGHFRSSLLEGAAAIPDGSYGRENMASTVVPFRNGIMLSIAVGMAESAGLKCVMMANHGGDHEIYPDCRPEFVESFCRASRLGTYARIDVLSPYAGLSKADIARRGKALGIDYSTTWSCYRGGERHCGRCATCLERRQALLSAGIDDPTEYEV